jgi:uncharacterized protein YjbI with pentapeptide repeats
MEFMEKLKKYTDYQNNLSTEVTEFIYEDIELDGIVFTGYDLAYALLLGVLFNNCDFTDVYLSEAMLNVSIFQKCIFHNNIFRKGDANRIKLIDTNISKLDSFRTYYFSSSLQNVNISDSELFRSPFNGSDFSNVTFNNVKLVQGAFDESQFVNVKFINCHFDDTTFKDIKGAEEIEFINASITIDGVTRQGLGNEIKDILIK